LQSTQIEKFFISIKKTLEWGIEIVGDSKHQPGKKIRQHLKVRNRKNQPCFNCSTKIRRANVYGHDSFFCPACQPSTTKSFIDWNQKLT